MFIEYKSKTGRFKVVQDNELEAVWYGYLGTRFASSKTSLIDPGDRRGPLTGPGALACFS